MRNLVTVSEMHIACCVNVLFNCNENRPLLLLFVKFTVLVLDAYNREPRFASGIRMLNISVCQTALPEKNCSCAPGKSVDWVCTFIECTVVRALRQVVSWNWGTHALASHIPPISQNLTFWIYILLNWTELSKVPVQGCQMLSVTYSVPWSIITTSNSCQQFQACPYQSLCCKQ